MTDISKAESLAINLARGQQRTEWVVSVRAGGSHTYFAVAKPLLPDLTINVIKHFLAGIGVTVEAEFDHTGRRII